MPWDATRLRVAAIEPDGTLGQAVLAAGGPDESIVQPEWAPDGTLHLISDRSGWWNLYRLVEGPRLEPLAPMDAEFADPAWIFGALVVRLPARRGDRRRSPAPDGPDQLYPHRARPARRARSRRRSRSWTRLQVGAHAVVALAGAPGDPSVVVALRPGRRWRRRASCDARAPSPSTRASSRPRADRVPDDGRPHGPRPLLPAAQPGVRRPRRRAAAARRAVARRPDVERVDRRSTSAKQLLTSRGIAVVDVDYGGSTGYGREYRRQLDGQWGVVDVDDCVAAAQFLVERGDVDPERLAIEGGSAGGYTTLAALAFRDVFAAGISLLRHRRSRDAGARHAQVRVALPSTGWSARIRRPRRSTASDRRSTSSTGSRCPVLILQGLDDRVVPPVAGRGDRRGAGRERHPARLPRVRGRGPRVPRRERDPALARGELSFLGQVFGFEPADELEPLAVPGLADGWPRIHRRPAMPSGRDERGVAHRLTRGQSRRAGPRPVRGRAAPGPRGAASRV